MPLWPSFVNQYLERRKKMKKKLKIVEVHLTEMILHKCSENHIKSGTIFLSDKDEREVPIWIGPLETYAIYTKFTGISNPRPMTHDLLNITIDISGLDLIKVIITELKMDQDGKNGTYYSQLRFKKRDVDEFPLDCRPSDAVALALRMDVPIFCNEELLCKPGADKQQSTVADKQQSTKMGVDIGGEIMTFNIETKQNSQ